jgi:DNA-binding transcriptional regulator YbjK
METRPTEREPRPRTPRGPGDPDRPARIARAALRVIEDRGISGLTHRAVAAEAGVPLGSTTYHFRSQDDILVAAMRVAVEDYEAEVGKLFEGRVDDVARRLTSFVVGKTSTPARRRKLAVSFELYLHAFRRPVLAPIGQAWDQVLMKALGQQLPPADCELLTVTATGLWLKAIVDDASLGEAAVRAAFARSTESEDR